LEGKKIMGNKYDSSFKSEVSLMALREEFTILEISKRYKLHPSVIKRWKSEALQGLKSVFEKGQKSELEASELKIEQLERKVGQLTIDNDFLKKITQSIC
jgi:transposase